jgi:hypothetical protein
MKALSIIEEDGVKRVNMANLAIIGELMLILNEIYKIKVMS